MKLLSWISLVFVIVFIFLSGSSFASPYISLSVPAHIYPGESIEARVNVSEIKSLQMSLFRIDEPENYILESNKEYFFSIDTWRPKRPLNEQEKWQNLKFSFFQSLRGIASKVLSPSLKQSLKDILGIEGSIPARPIEITSDDYHRNSSLLKSWLQEIRYSKDDFYAYQTITLNPLQEGVYLLTAAGGGKEARVIFSVTRLSLISKVDQNQMVVFVQDRKSGQILEKVRMRLLENNQVVSEGETNSEGLWSKTELKQKEMTIMAQMDNEYAFMNIYPYYFDSSSKLDVFIYTERPLYKPGQRVYFKSLLREKLATSYFAPPPGEKVKAVLTDYRDNIYSSTELVSDEYGNLSSWFDLPMSLDEGDYLIKLSWKNSDFYRMVSIENYEKPSFEAEVKTEKETYANREKVTVKVQANYYSGQPLTPGTFRYQILRYPMYYWRYGFQSEMVEENTGTLDENGEAEITFIPEVEGNAYWYEAQVGVFDAAYRGVQKTAQVKVLMGDFALVLKSNRYFVGMNQNLQYTVEAFDAEEKKVDVGKVYATIYLLTWDKEKKDWNETSAKLFSFEVVNGKADIDFAMEKPGYYRLECETRDEKGNTITASDTFYVTGSGFYLPTTGIELHLDKKEYKVGETANVLVVPPVTEEFPHLLTIEGEKIHQIEVKSTVKGPYQVSIPITKDYILGCYVTLSTFYNGNYYNESIQIPVIPEKELLVKISTEKEVYLPQEKGKLKVTILGSDSLPRKCDFSLAIVDQAIFDISWQWWEKIYEHYYQNLYNRVYTQSSWYEYFYGQGETVQNVRPQFKGNGRGGAGEPTVRKYFPDTLLWMPSIKTNQQGEAEIEFTCPDNLASWRVEVRANTADEFGESVINFRTSSPFAFRVELPPFLSQGDTIQTQMTLWNEYPKQKVRLEAQTGSEIKIGTYPPEVEIDANQNLVIPVQFQAIEAGLPYVRMYARGDLAGDAIEVTQKVKPRGVEIEQFFTTFVSDEKGRLNFTYQPEMFNHPPQVECILYRNLNGVFYQIMEDMYYYPYGCTEQTSSRIISLLSLPLPDNLEWTKTVPREIQEGIYQLYALQHYDGGWGWWNLDDSNVFNTSHALLALITAREKGYLVSENSILQAKSYLMSINKDLVPWEKAMSYYVLSQVGEKITDLTSFEIDKRLERMDVKELAWLSLVAQGKAQQSLLKELIKRAQPIGDAVFYGYSNPEKPWEDDRFLATCWATLALNKENRSIAEKSFLWLLRNIQSEWYINTIEKAYFMKLALLFQEESMVSKTRYQIMLNSEKTTEGQFESDSFSKKIDLNGEKLLSGENQLELFGEGVYLMTVKIRGFTSGLPPSSQIKVSKNYWKLKPIKNEEGNFIFTKEAISSLQPGDELVCEILIESPHQFDNLVIEDGMAAGFELIRNDYVYQLQDDRAHNNSDFPIYVNKKIYDQLPVLFVSRIEEGENMIRYYLRVRDAGSFYVRPTQAYLMYFPEVRGYSKEHEFTSGR